MYTLRKWDYLLSVSFPELKVKNATIFIHIEVRGDWDGEELVVVSV
jgi:hypothetical protein